MTPLDAGHLSFGLSADTTEHCLIRCSVAKREAQLSGCWDK